MALDGVQEDDGTFIRPSLEDVLDRKRDRAEENFGADVDLSQGSPVKQIIDTTAAEHDYLWKAMEDVYYSAYYAEAYGEQLDKILQIASVNRRPRRGATGMVTFGTSTANTEDVVVPEGARVATRWSDDRPSIPFKTTEPARLPAGQSSVTGVPIRACEPWETDISSDWLGAETNVAANTIVEMETAIGGIDRVHNPYPTGASSREHGYSFIQGRDRETDRELRARFERKFGSEAHATLDAVRAEVLDAEGILNVGVEENVTMEDNRETGGLPPKSFRVTALGDAASQDVAQAIYDKRPVGIQSYGTESDEAFGSDDQIRREYWDWAEEVSIHMNVNVTHTDDYPSDGNLEVETAIINYVGGETAEGDIHVGTGMEEDVIYDMVHSAAMSVSGVWRVDIEMGDDPDDLMAEDVLIGENETALTRSGDVNIFNTQESV